MASHFSGLPGDVSSLLASPPLTETRLAELELTWHDLPPAEAKVAGDLRVFVVTWDPLEWSFPRPVAVGTVNTAPREIVVYVPVWRLTELAEERGVTVADVLSELGGIAVTNAVTHAKETGEGRFPELVFRGRVPDLMSGEAPGFGQAAISAVSQEWDPLGLGAIQDFIQQAYGPVDLDRSLVELASVDPWPGCPACAGRRFRFPAELGENSEFMCRPHRDEADRVMRRRLDQAQRSNPAGWRAMTEAAARNSLPHLSRGLATKLAGTGLAGTGLAGMGLAGMGLSGRDTPDDQTLARRARLVVEACADFVGRPDDFAHGFDREGQLPGWLTSLARVLGRAGLTEEALAVSDALARVDPGRQVYYETGAAVALAEAGQADEARSRIGHARGQWPDDPWVLAHSGEIVRIHGDLAGAVKQLGDAMSLALASGDHATLAEVTRLHTRASRALGRERDKRIERVQPRSRVQRKRRR
jgi:hypothetical protein